MQHSCPEKSKRGRIIKFASSSEPAGTWLHQSSGSPIQSTSAKPVWKEKGVSRRVPTANPGINFLRFVWVFPSVRKRRSKLRITRKKARGKSEVMIRQKSVSALGSQPWVKYPPWCFVGSGVLLILCRRLSIAKCEAADWRSLRRCSEKTKEVTSSASHLG